MLFNASRGLSLLVRWMSMRPGQLEPNEFEIELFKRFAAQDPA